MLRAIFFMSYNTAYVTVDNFAKTEVNTRFSDAKNNIPPRRPCQPASRARESTRTQGPGQVF